MRPIKETVLSLLAGSAIVLCYLLATSVLLFHFGNPFRSVTVRDNPRPSVGNPAPNLVNLNPDHSLTC